MCAPALRLCVAVSERAGGAAENAVDASARGGGGFAVAFSGGSLPKVAGAALTQEPHRSAVGWGAWRVFYADERCVPLDHADSNHLALKTQLLDKLPPGAIPQAQIFTIDPAAGEPAQQAAAYEAAVRKERPGGELDVILLGMGEVLGPAPFPPSRSSIHICCTCLGQSIARRKMPPAPRPLAWPLQAPPRRRTAARNPPHAGRGRTATPRRSSPGTHCCRSGRHSSRRSSTRPSRRPRASP
jgi:hypothetical protein